MFQACVFISACIFYVFNVYYTGYVCINGHTAGLKKKKLPTYLPYFFGLSSKLTIDQDVVEGLVSFNPLTTHLSEGHGLVNIVSLVHSMNWSYC